MEDNVNSFSGAAEKKELRSYYKKKRTNLDEESIKRAKASIRDVEGTVKSLIDTYRDMQSLEDSDRDICDICGRLKRPMNIMSYMPIKNEFPVDAINRFIIDSEKYNLILPLTTSDFEIIPYIVDDIDNLKISELGIAEPDPKKTLRADSSSIDMIIIPGIVFDRFGNRIGFGRGCYDRFIAKNYAKDYYALNYDSNCDSNCDSNRKDCKNKYGRLPLLVGACYDFQIFPGEIPTDKYDISMQILITEKGIVTL